jgi:hypothetical protein
MDTKTQNSTDWFAKALQYEQAGKLREADLFLKKALERETQERAGS